MSRRREARGERGGDFDFDDHDGHDDVLLMGGWTKQISRVQTFCVSMGGGE